MLNLESRKTFYILFLIALVVTAINAVKPVHIDDAYYFRLAEQISQHPLDPFGFEVFWQQWPMMAYDNYVPPLLPYWFGGALFVLGDDPFMIKLALLPFVLLFVLAVYGLGRRFAPELAVPLTFFLALSPAVLPSWNMMLDLPAISLGFAAILIAMSAIDRHSWKLAFVAACLAALTALTKFTGLAVPGVILVYSLVQRRPLFGIGIGLFVLVVIILWELIHLSLYGHTQLLWGLSQGYNNTANLGSFDELLFAVIPTLGGLFFLSAGVFYPVAVKGRWFLLWVAMAMICAIIGYVLGIFTGRLDIAFWLLGAVLLAVVAGSLFLAYRENVIKGDDPLFLFLFGWLFLEIIAYFLISPFPATRRVIGLGIVLTLLAFRLLSNRLSAATVRTVTIGCWLLVSGNLGFAGLYALTDYAEADAQKTLAEDSIKQIRTTDPESRIWYAGHWGYGYYAAREGMTAVVPDHSQLEAGDWLVQLDRVHRQLVAIDPDTVTVAGFLELNDDVPLFTLPGFYSGRYPMAIKPDETRMRAYIFQSNIDQVLKTPTLSTARRE